MKRIIVGWLIVIFLLPQYPVSAELIKISDHVYSYLDIKNPSPQTSFGANAGIVIGTKGIAVIDTRISAKAAKEFLKDIRQVTDKPIRYIINTHYHLDHAFGNSEFTADGAILIGHDKLASNIRQVSHNALEEAKKFGMTSEDLEGTRIVMPDVTFEDKLTLDVGEITIELIYLGPSHTSDSILVYLPGERLLFSGDILFTDFHPFMGEANVEGWLKVLDYVLYMDVEDIIPGHGPLSMKRDIQDLTEYLELFDTQAKAFCSKTSDLKVIEEEMIRVLPKRSRGAYLIPANISMKYLSHSSTIGAAMPYQFEIKDQQTQAVLSIRTRSSVENLPEIIGLSYGMIMKYMDETGTQPAGPPFAAYYNMDMQNLDVEIGFPVSGKLPGKGDIQASEIPQSRMATCLHIGPYNEIRAAYQALSAWISENGYEVTGIAYEFYLNDPSVTQPSELKTQIAFPLKPGK